ncbi:MAG: 3-dehydroquinate synthase [Desulfatiglandales bacterium]
MKTVRIQGSSRDSTILIGERIENVGKYLPRTDPIIISDTNVYRRHHGVFPAGDRITIGTGEKIKGLDTVRFVLERLLEIGADRSAFILAIGGGIVCDIAGFVASIYLRGVRFGFVSSTLLSQVDASVGGKNGVNFAGFKNMVGTFNQPDFVICDPFLLKTLPERERLNGCAEIVKHAAIGDRALFSYLETHYNGVRELERDVIERVVHDSVVLKAGIVNRDERERGERRKLNFGHTVGHAIEKVAGVPHGEAVSAGMAAAARVSERRGLLSGEDRERIERLLSNLKLPVCIEVDKERLFEAMSRDKKREGERIHFVLLKGIGEAVVQEMALDELKSAVFG